MKKDPVKPEISLETKKDDKLHYLHYLKYYCKNLKLWPFLKFCDIYYDEEDTLGLDEVAQIPPLKEQFARVKVKSVEKATPCIVEPVEASNNSKKD